MARPEQTGEALGCRRSRASRRSIRRRADEEADDLFGHFAFFQSFGRGPRFRRPDPCAAVALRDGLERARTLFRSAFVVCTGRRVGADDEEVVGRGEALVARAGRQDGDVAGLQREDPTLLAAEADAALPRAMTEHLMDSGVIVHVVVDAVAPCVPHPFASNRSSITAAGS